jgi:two-component system LytT family response regulator
MTAVPMPAVKELRVVVVDDEPLVREDIVQLLSGRAGVDVVATCANGIEALDAVRRLQPDVLLLDIRMPGIDGFGVVEKLDRRELPYVVLRDGIRPVCD